ncbi:MAG TPA: histidine--tRNA ligase [Candidatus Saccharimonadales bacterium]|nr:histidine--tRNA ligase [Candidatus Saccharimonadales bacterium]
MKLSTQPYKGTRDFYPEDKRVQKYLFGVWRQVCESFGYEEYDAPILEPTELYLSKGNQEIIDEQTYTFEDRGKRSVTMRTEMTPTVSRLVAGRRQELAYPLRWYSIPNLWRYERPQKGRLREHWQLNVDIFGVSGTSAELELIQIVDGIMGAFGASAEMYTIKLNSRKFMDYVLSDYAGFEAKQRLELARLIDRLKKMPYDEFVAKVDAIATPAQRKDGAVEKLLTVLSAKTLKDLPKDLQSYASINELKVLLSALDQLGVKNAEFDVTVMRGFDYYTDIVFEAFDNNPDNNRSMFGGGRYDGLISLFGVEPLPTVGFGMGDVTLTEFLRGHRLLPDLVSETAAYLALVGDVHTGAQKLAAELRKAGMNVAVDLSGRKLGDQFKIAEKKGIQNVLIVGENELKTGQFTLKNLKTGKEQKLDVKGLEKALS